MGRNVSCPAVHKAARAAVAATVLASAATGLIIARPALSSAEPTCAAVPADDPGTATGWIGYLAANKDNVSVVIDDGQGGVINHRADAPMPTASMAKVVHIAALGRGVAAGRVNESDSIPIADWQKWYVSIDGTPLDGGAHIEALDYLGIPAVNGVPVDLTATVTLGQLADVTIRFSDSAAPDALSARLGVEAMTAVMTDYGFPGPVPSFFDTYNTIVASNATTDAELTAAVEATYSAPAAPFARLMRDIATGDFGSGTDVARRYLDRDQVPGGLATFGFKGGSLPGVLTDAFEGTRADGTATVGVLMVRRAAQADLQAAVDAQLPEQELLLTAMTDRSTLDSITCALRP